MEQMVMSFGAGVVVSAIVFFFVWRNNKAWFATAEVKVNAILDAAKAGNLSAELKAQLEALLAEIQGKK